MPRCQRTFERLPEAECVPGTGALRWACACCTPPASYDALRDPDLLQYAHLAQNACASDFGAPGDASRPFLLILGQRPECVLEYADRRYDIYLARGSDPYQARLQIGHEMFHRVCSQGRIFHWTHEMLACLTALRLLRRTGAAEYAAREEARYREEAGLCPFPALLAADPWRTAAYPPGYYGRATTLGLALTAAVGWDRLRRLARCLTPQGSPDVEGWLASLPLPEAASARACLAEAETTAADAFPESGASGTIPEPPAGGDPDDDVVIADNPGEQRGLRATGTG